MLIYECFDIYMLFIRKNMFLEDNIMLSYIYNI